MGITLSTSITPELAEETGWHIGDGSMNIYNKDGGRKGFYQLRGHIEDDKNHYQERIKPMFKRLYNIDISLRTMPKTRVFGFQLWNNDLVNFKQKLGLPLGKKFDIVIPKIFLKKEIIKISVLRGIFDTDGGIYLEPKNNKLYPISYITTISENLSQQIYTILQELNIPSTITSHIDKRRNREKSYRVNIRGSNNCSKFMEIIRPANVKFINKYQKFLNSKSL
ncbi:MAG: LAGLIDADG family homing endonuclease [Nanoarchaeota archaeon]|nr:LAGLIDADG family homing endonuclease [Nanoarchaeota archaeon]